MATRARRVPRTEDRPSLRLVEGRRRRAIRSILIPAAAVLVVGVFAVGGLQAYLAQEGFRAARIERELRQAEEDYALLRSELARLSSPARLEAEAKRIGMTDPASPVFLRAPQEATTEDGHSAPSPYAAKRYLTGGPGGISERSERPPGLNGAR